MYQCCIGDDLTISFAIAVNTLEENKSFFVGCLILKML